MVRFADVIERVKEVLSSEKNEKILYKDIAESLGLGQDYFAVIKRRGKIPYEALAVFADRQNVSLNWILLGSNPKDL